MVELDFKDLCAKVIRLRKFKNNDYPYEMEDNNYSSTTENGCRDYNVEFSIKRSASSLASVRQCPTLPELYLAGGYPSVSVLRPLRMGSIKVTYDIPE